MALKKFERGELLTADRLNELIDEVIRGRLITCDDSIQLTRGPFGTTISVRHKPLGILYRNDYTGTVPAYGIVSVKSIDTTNPGLPMAVTDRPSTTFRQINLINGDFEVAEDQYGLAQLGPRVIFAYDSGSPALGEGFGPKPSQFTAAQNYPNVLTCIGIVDSTPKWALGMWSPLITEVFAQTQGSIAKNATNGIVEPFFGSPGSGATIINASMTITGVCNPWETVDDNKKVLVRWVNGLPTLTGKEC